jgi:hypothetical protein
MYIKRPLLLTEVWNTCNIAYCLPLSKWTLNRQQLSLDLPISICHVTLGGASGPQWAKGYEIGRILKINRME